MPTILTFNAANVRTLLNHAYSSEFHKPTIAQRLQIYGPEAWDQQPSESIETPPGLWLVKDQGIYLMSNGLPGLLLTDRHHYVVYADTYDPRTDGDVWDRSRAAVGGDDFCEFIDREWEQALRPLDQYLYITIDETRLQITGGPRQPSGEGRQTN